MSSHSDSNAKSPLDAAQKIVVELTGMTTELQLLALKFAVETLGLKFPANVAPVAPLPVRVAEEAPQRAAHGAHHTADIRSFTEMKAPKSDRQFCAVVAYFYQLEAKPDEQKDAIDADTMKEAARLAKWPQVTRWGMTLTNAKNAGYLDAVGNGKFKLSSVGENLVAITLPGDGAAGVGKNAGARKPKRKASKKSANKKK